MRGRLAILSVVIIVIFLLSSVVMNRFKKEMFGMSPGTLDQLASTHVPSSLYEAEQEWIEEQRRIQRDLIDMTGGV